MINVEENIKENLNEQQKEAVLNTEGPLLILAGAGAGKTKTITHRILNLIQNGVNPASILAITFTNKAAKEMRERVNRLLSSDMTINRPISMDERPFISTFHALGVHIIKEQCIKLDIPRHFTIYDRNDSKKAVKDAIESLNLDPKQYEPGLILNVISREKGDAVTHSAFREKAADYFSNVVADVWDRYEATLKKEKSLDFDDLLLKTALLLKHDTNVRDHYSSVWQYVHVDEYQDTNKVQYEIVKLLSEKHKNIAVVGDIDQCLLPETDILTPQGIRKIDTITPGMEIISAAGNGYTCKGKVTHIHSREYSGEMITLITENKQKITATPGHIFFARLSTDRNNYYVYLMHRRNKGYRIGMAKSIRKSAQDVESIGLQVRCNQEKADKIWILKICTTKQEALREEMIFAAKYGIPTAVFSVAGRNMLMRQKDIDLIFSTIDTRERIKKLFKETHLSPEYPHYLPQGTTRTNTDRQRINIRLTMFDDKRKSIRNPWGLSRIAINTTDNVFKEILIKNDFPVRRGKNNDWRMEISRLDYGEAEILAKRISTLHDNLTIYRTISLVVGKKMAFQPAGNLLPGMKIGVLNDGKIVEETITQVTRENYKGKVYDVDVDKVHNYIANNIPVHNCIYSWRGASIANILNFEKDYPTAKVILLEENYRSTQTILAAANGVIEKNKLRRDKTLFTKNAAGEKIELTISYTEIDEARAVASKAAELINENNNDGRTKKVEPRDSAVLYRANFQSRVLEEAFLREHVPYQILGTRFFDRKEIKDVISFIRAAVNRDSSNDMVRVINVPPRGIGKATMIKVIAGQTESLGPALRQKVSTFMTLLDRIKQASETEPPAALVKYILRESGMEASFRNGTAEGEEKLENIKELVSVAAQYGSIEALLENAALATDQDELEKDNNAIKLMTVHASKGLEFDYVFITGLEEDLFPHKRMNEHGISQAEEEEERRLFYVALTRAKKKVFLSYAQIRTIFGSQKINAPSEFIGDIDKGLINEQRELLSIDF